jgi:hypothetical protein
MEGAPGQGQLCPPGQGARHEEQGGVEADGGLSGLSLCSYSQPHQPRRFLAPLVCVCVRAWAK